MTSLPLLDVEMADRNQKDATPPPLLLMPAGDGLTMNVPGGSNFLMPVMSSDASLFPQDLEGEADSFVGQTPPDSNAPSPAPYSMFGTPNSGAADPFGEVGVTPSSTFTPQIPMQAPLSSAGGATPGFPTGGPPMGGTPSGRRNPLSGPRKYISAPEVATSSTMHAPPGPGTLPPPSGLPPALGYPPVPGPGGMLPPPSSTSSIYPPSTSPPEFPTGAPTSQSQQPDYSQPPINPGGVPGEQPGIYNPIKFHWFYSKHIELTTMWFPFSNIDNQKLEDAYRSDEASTGGFVIPTDGGRYDVDLQARQRKAIYWEENPTEVRRCSWFFKRERDNRFVPYDESFSDKLEEEYKNAITNNVWHKRLEFPGGETIVMHNPNVIVHFRASAQPDEWGTTASDMMRPRVVRRGIEEFDDIPEGEPRNIDHVIFIVHGIGQVCDLRGRSIVEGVDDFRSISLQLIDSHFKPYKENNQLSRIEFIPVHWHAALHGDATGVDRRLKAITLGSIAKLRHFTNDTLLDILFYTSPTYCQTIADTVTSEISRLYKLFTSRNSNYKGGVSLAGHSLGSLILFDLLAHQRDPLAPEPVVADPVETPKETQEVQEVSKDDIDLDESSNAEEDEKELSLEELLAKLGLSDYLEAFQKEKIDMETLIMCEESDIKEMGIPMGPRKKLQGFMRDLKHKEEKKRLAAERRAMLLEERAKREEERQRKELAAIEQQQQLELQKSQMTDPLLSKASSLSIDYMTGVQGIGSPFVQYNQLDFTPSNFFALGSPTAMFMTVRGTETLGEEFRFPTCPGFFNIFHPFDPIAYRMEPLINPEFNLKPIQMQHHKGRKRLHLELKESLARMGSDIKQKFMESIRKGWNTLSDFAKAHRSEEQVESEVNEVMQSLEAEVDQAETSSIASSINEDEVPIGSLNQGGRRVDYVLQEKPIESFNDYLFALGSH
ncbi:unnamed protein product, partial [Owenia fusiformis]